jgi:hypothetical protein
VLDAAEEWLVLLEDPRDETEPGVLAAALGQLHGQAQAGERLDRWERRALTVAQVNAPVPAAERLAADEDFRTGKDGELNW